MKFLHLVWASLFRKKVRTILTLLSIVFAFLLFGMLDAVRVAFTVRDSLEGASRLVVSSKLSIIQPLPYSDLAQIKRVPGVEQVAFANWFGGIYQDRRNFFANFAVSPNYLDMYPEFLLPEEQKQAFLNTRTGAVVGANLARRYNFKIGDKIPLQATIFPHKNGSNTWTFDLVGIFRARETRDRNQEDQMMFHYEYFDEGRTFGHGTVGWYMVKVSDPEHAQQAAQSHRPPVRQLGRRNQDPDREAVQSGFRQTDRRHRSDRQLDHGRGVFHHFAAHRQHHVAGGARAHPGAGGAQDHRLFQSERIMAGAR